MKKTKNMKSDDDDNISDQDEIPDKIDKAPDEDTISTRDEDVELIDYACGSIENFSSNLEEEDHTTSNECALLNDLGMDPTDSGESMDSSNEPGQEANRIRIVDVTDQIVADANKLQNDESLRTRHPDANRFLEGGYTRNLGYTPRKDDVSSTPIENGRYKFMSDSYDRKQSDMRKGFNAENEYKDENMHEKQHTMYIHELSTKDSTILEREKQTELFFDVICTECNRLGIQCDSKQTNALYHLLRISNYEAEKLGLELYEDNNPFMLDKSMRRSPRKKRGRPPLISPELASSEFDEYGVKIDYEGGGIDFDDSLFDTINADDKEIYICKTCLKPFPSKSRAKRHYITHTGYKPFKCGNPECDKTFSRRDNMLQHERMHCSATRKKDPNEKR